MPSFDWLGVSCKVVGVLFFTAMIGGGLWQTYKTKMWEPPPALKATMLR